MKTYVEVVQSDLLWWFVKCKLPHFCLSEAEMCQVLSSSAVIIINAPTFNIVEWIHYQHIIFTDISAITTWTFYAQQHRIALQMHASNKWHVWLSVCLSVTHWYWVKTNKHISTAITKWCGQLHISWATCAPHLDMLPLSVLKSSMQRTDKWTDRQSAMHNVTS